MPQEKILIVDDEPQVRGVLESFFHFHQFEVTSVSDGSASLEMVAREDFALAIVDLEMPGIPGMEVVRLLKKQRPDIEIIIFTGNPSFESSQFAVHEHVSDYVCKPCHMPMMLKIVQRALEHRRLILDNRRLLQQLENERNQLEQEVISAQRAVEHRLRQSPSFLGKSAKAEEIRHQIAKVAPSRVNVLLLGESGTGKDVIAQLIHESSGRDPEAFVKVNCPAIPESLLESELFGHEAGAFTGAMKRKPGRFELASGGTIFLDEIGDLPFNLQSKLLQAVEQKQFYSVGGKKPSKIDVRIIAATNAPLSDMIQGGKFRADLYYRLSEYTIEIPPLRERKEDILLLADHFLTEYKKQFDCPEREYSSEARSQLEEHYWPGNIRELQSIVRRFALTGWQESLRDNTVPTVIPVPAGQVDLLPQLGDGDLQLIRSTLVQLQWNRRKAAEKLGMSYSTLRRRISQYNLKSA